MKIILIILGLPKTIWFNLRSLPLRYALRLPILLSPLTRIVSSHGRVEIKSTIKTGMISFGLSGFGLAVQHACVIQNNGKIVFNGKTWFGGGTKISCNAGGCICFGEHTVITGNCILVSNQSIVFGADCLIAWNTQFMDNDLHHLITEEEKESIDQSIIVGDHVWICSNVVVNKGAQIPTGSVIGSNTLVSKEFNNENCLIAGIPASIKKENIRWES